VDVNVCRIVDCLQECCHCNETSVVITSIDLINELLTSLDQLINSDVTLLPFDSSLTNSSPADTDIGINSCLSFNGSLEQSKWEIIAPLIDVFLVYHVSFDSCTCSNVVDTSWYIFFVIYSVSKKNWNPIHFMIKSLNFNRFKQNLQEIMLNNLSITVRNFIRKFWQLFGVIKCQIFVTQNPENQNTVFCISWWPWLWFPAGCLHSVFRLSLYDC